MPILLQRGARLENEALQTAEKLKEQGYTMKYDSQGNYRIVSQTTGEDYRGDLLGGLGIDEGIFTKKRGRKRAAGRVMGNLYSEGFWGKTKEQKDAADAAYDVNQAQATTDLKTEMDENLAAKLAKELPVGKEKTLEERQDEYDKAVKKEFDFEEENIDETVPYGHPYVTAPAEDDIYDPSIAYDYFGTDKLNPKAIKAGDKPPTPAAPYKPKMPLEDVTRGLGELVWNPFANQMSTAASKIWKLLNLPGGEQYSKYTQEHRLPTWEDWKTK